jgi:nitrite reductase (NO-forming)
MVRELEPTVEITIYGGELPGGRFGFGLSPENITSPGPTLNFRVGDVVKITFVNVGKIPHAFAVTMEISDSPVILFNSAIGSGAQPLAPGESRSVIISLNQAGRYTYLCTVQGHAQLGMWGELIVSP